MAHTRRMSVKHGVLTLTLICSGLSTCVVNAQDGDGDTATADSMPIIVDMATPPQPESDSVRADAPAIVIDMATPLESQTESAFVEEPSTLGVYRGYIESIETSAGAFAPGLTEQLLGLGLNLQSLGRHVEAAEVLKRGVHISRIQSGLYGADQIPLLRAEIRSLAALGFYDDVNERQAYLARVESEALAGTPASIAALLDQAAWAEQAWALGLGEAETHPEHLARSWEYYRLAYNQSSQLYGDRSQALLAPLEGMLRIHYRFALLQKARGSNDAFRVDSFRQSSALGGIYRRGEAVLSAIYGLNSLHGADAGEQATDLTRLGDWAWWMGRRADATSYYDRAWRRVTPPPAESADPALASAAGDIAASDGLTGQGAASEPPAADDAAQPVSARDLAVAEASVSNETAAPSASAEVMTPAPAPATTAMAVALDDAPVETPFLETAATETAPTEPSTPLDRRAEAQSESETGGEQSLALAAEPTPDSEEATTPAPPEAPLSEDNPLARAALFQTVTPLPDIELLRRLPPFTRDDSGPVVVQLQINEMGKITLLEQVIASEVVTEETAADEPDDTPTEVDTAAEVVAVPDMMSDNVPEVHNKAGVDRLLRTIRRTRFRPRYEAGVPVETDILVWSFDLNATNRDAIGLQPQ